MRKIPFKVTALQKKCQYLKVMTLLLKKELAIPKNHLNKLFLVILLMTRKGIKLPCNIILKYKKVVQLWLTFYICYLFNLQEPNVYL